MTTIYLIVGKAEDGHTTHTDLFGSNPCVYETWAEAREAVDDLRADEVWGPNADEPGRRHGIAYWIEEVEGDDDEDLIFEAGTHGAAYARAVERFLS